MKTYKTYSILTLFFLVGQFAFAQFASQKKADYYFSKFSYAKAIPEYERMIDSDLNSEYAHQQLAECYLLIRDYKKSIPHFQAVINNATLPTDYYFKYAMALYANGDLDESEKWIKKYKKYNKNDSRVKRFLKDGNLASVVFNSRQRYEVEPVSFNSTDSDFGISRFKGNLYFGSSRRDEVTGDTYGWNDEPWLDLFVVQEDNDMSMPKRLKGNVNTKFHESSVAFSTDYKNDTIMYFTRNNFYDKKEGYGASNEINLKIYTAKFIDGEWVENSNLRINSDYYSTGHPSVNKARTRIYFTSDRPGGYGGTDIYYAEIHERGGIQTPVNAGPIVNTEGNEMFPFINEEGKLFFSSDGHVGFGQLDVFSTISDEDGKVIDIINLGTPINSSSDDFAYYGLPNGLEGYISSNREGGMGSDDIYKFKFTPSLDVEGYVVDGVNEQMLDSVQIKLYDQITNTMVAQTMTDENGYYRFPVNRKTTYMIEAVRKTHPHKNVYFNTSETPKAQKILRQDIVLEPVLDLKLLAGLNKIYFDFNKSDIRPDAAKELDKVIKVMNQTYPDMIIKLESHTDPVGSHAYNDNLSESRAKSTYEYLIENGVSKDRIVSYKGFGKRMPINKCTSKQDCTPEELELNRRTEFPILQIKKGRSVSK
ncbi:Outer membrane protein OmpA [Maribacter sedimenticola]|uniref:Outer membrane protein OmpA n=1 Tax=Maribacter sedimenticola TaxID=228956 RepID=A0ABY1SME1_9FLAO|nr:OmpA family protein [Maribacter sedimenticola]SNR81820.1 Outer membrane protein OmpA [Maribacter sedimenticola]